MTRDIGLLKDTWESFQSFMPTQEEKERWTSRERMLWVADVLAFHPERHRQTTWLENMETFYGVRTVSNVDCNTAGCVAGWACTTTTEEFIGGWVEDARVALGLDYGDAEEMFRASNDRDMLIVMLRYMATSGHHTFAAASAAGYVDQIQEGHDEFWEATPDGRAEFITDWNGWDR